MRNSANAFAICITVVGKLCFFEITYGDLMKALRSLDGSLKKGNPKKLVRALAKYTCFLLKSERETDSDDDCINIDDKRLNDLADADLDNIAAIYLYANRYLLENNTKFPAAEQKDVHELSTFAFIENKRQPSETDSELLHRLMVLEESRELAFVQSMIGQKFKSTSFSPSLTSGIAESLRQGEKLLQSMKGLGLNTEIYSAAKHGIGLREEMLNTIKSQVPDSAWISTLITDQAARQNQRLTIEPIRDYKIELLSEISQRLEGLQNANVKLIEYMVEENKIQNTIASEIKNSSNDATYVSKVNIRLSWVVIGITLISLAITTLSSFTGNKSIDTKWNTADSLLREMVITMKTENDTDTLTSISSEQINLEILNTLEIIHDDLSKNRSSEK